MTAYYSEFDPFAAQWLRNLIAAGRIAPGDVDERSIKDVKADDLKTYAQAHFFAGIGVWSHALRLAGWGDDRPVWTGSCPCQPFSAAGKRQGTADDRHLWPTWFNLIQEQRPPIVFGEQVASKDGLGWFDLVHADLESSGYAVGAADLCAAGVGAPHVRQRLWFVAYGDHPRLEMPLRTELQRRGDGLARASGNRRLGDAEGKRLRRGPDDDDRGGWQPPLGRPGEGGLAYADGGLAYADGGNAVAERQQRSGEHGFEPQDCSPDVVADAVQSGRAEGRPLAGGGPFAGGFWSRAEGLHCTDGKTRLVEPGVFPLAHGAAQRMGRLRAYGNAICPQVAKAFIEVAMEYAP